MALCKHISQQKLVKNIKKNKIKNKKGFSAVIISSLGLSFYPLFFHFYLNKKLSV